MNPLDLTGPEFLKLYGGLLAGAVIGAIWLRWLFRQPADELAELPELTPYEVAYLAEGDGRTLAVALAKLVRANAIAVDAQERCVRRIGVLPSGAEPIDDAISTVIAVPSHQSDNNSVNTQHGTTLGEIRSAAAEGMIQIRQRLEELGLLVTSEQGVLVRWVPTVLVLTVALWGCLKIWIGISRDKSVFILVWLTGIAAVIAFAGFARRVHRSRRGDRVLHRIQAEQSALTVNALSAPETIEEADWDLAIALVGLEIAMHLPLADLKAALQPPAGTGNGGADFGGSGCGSGCGGGGCGGGCGGCGG